MDKTKNSPTVVDHLLQIHLTLVSAFQHCRGTHRENLHEGSLEYLGGYF